MRYQSSKNKEFIKALEEYIKSFKTRIFIGASSVTIEDLYGNKIIDKQITTGVQNRRVITNRMS